VSQGPSFGADWSASRRRGTDAELRVWLEVALAICDDADARALAHFRRDLRIEAKPDRSFVTQADTEVERAIRERLADAFPDHGVVGEEFGTEAGDAPIRWYVDPIDGTHNFMRGLPVFATLLAVERDGELQVAAMSAPALGERWWGWRGGGAWARTRGAASARRLAVSGVRALEDAQFLYGSARDIAVSGRAPGFQGLLHEVWRERGYGDFWSYALLAEGAADAVFEVDLNAWDSAAPTLIVEEAGGTATDLQGDHRLDSGTFLASNGHLHEVVGQRLLRGER